MAGHDIIDNRETKLVDQINRVLDSADAARFAVGYFFLSGFAPLAARLGRVRELRLLIGNTTTRETIEQLAEGYRRLELVADRLEAEAYPKRTEQDQSAAATAAAVGAGLAAMDQTDDNETVVKTLVELIESKKIKVKVYTRGRLHAKAYIFDYGQVFDDKGRAVERMEQGLAVVGSSNLTLAGVTHNTELNVVIHGNDNHAELVRWFDRLWDESQEFDAALLTELRAGWPLATVTPYDLYMKTLYELVRDRIEEPESEEPLWGETIFGTLADFQKRAVGRAVRLIRANGGAFVADVVGLGKSFIGAAIVKYFREAERARPLIICPAPLTEMWEQYNEIFELDARVLSMGFLYEEEGAGAAALLDEVKYKDRDFVLIDESHNFRNPDSQRYRVLKTFLQTGRRCCLLTATPRNRSVWDIYHQLKLFHHDDLTQLPVDPPNLREYFKLAEKGERQLPELLSQVLIRRRRRDILRWFGYDAETEEKVDPDKFAPYESGQRRAYVLVGGRKQFFPDRELETVRYSLEDTYTGLYQELRGYLRRRRREQLATSLGDELTYARYGIWHYVRPEKQEVEPYTTLHHAGQNLRGIMRVLLFKRLESSVYAFTESVRRLLRIHERFLMALDQGIVPAGEDAQDILYESDKYEEQELMEALRATGRRYALADFDAELLRDHIRHDIGILKRILAKVEPIGPKQDAKLQTIKGVLNRPAVKQGKTLIFTQYADTARYLHDNLRGKRDDVEVIYSNDRLKTRMVGRFAPLANPHFKPKSNEPEINTMISTDVLAEGFNLQDCDKIINYDLHWNPVRLIQRFGRIDRIGSTHETVYGFNFLPELGIEKHLDLTAILRNRIQEIHDTIGEDSAILDQSERLNPDAMYAIYDARDGAILGEETTDGGIDLGEAEEIIRQLHRENPAEFARIAALRDGLRVARSGEPRGTIAFCRQGSYPQLILADDQGEVITRDVRRILSILRCEPGTKSCPLPPQYNRMVNRILHGFSDEAKHRGAELTLARHLTLGQQYVINELGLVFRLTDDEGLKTQIARLEPAFRGPLTGAVLKELNQLRRGGVNGEALVGKLIEIYKMHSLGTRANMQSLEPTTTYPVVVCSESIQ